MQSNMSKLNARLEKSVVSAHKDVGSVESTIERLAISRCRSDRSSSFAHILASPVHYEPNYAYPLLIWLHDSGKSEIELFDVVPKISAQNYVAVAPRGLANVTRRIVRSRIHNCLVDEKSWSEPQNDWPETEFGISEAENLVFESLGQAVGKFNINPRRIFLIGRGTGATMALRIGLRNPSEFAGVISIDGAFPSLDNLLLRNWRTLRDLPLLMTTGGSATSFSRLSAKQLQLLHTAGMTVVIRQYNETPNIADATRIRMDKILADVNRWIMKRSLNPQAPMVELFGRA